MCNCEDHCETVIEKPSINNLVTMSHHEHHRHSTLH